MATLEQFFNDPSILENVRELNKDLDWQDLKVDHPYFYEESYYIQGIFRIIEDRSDETTSRFLIRMETWLGGVAKFQPGPEPVEIEVARSRHDRKYDWMMKQRFRYVGSEGEYIYREFK